MAKKYSMSFSNYKSMFGNKSSVDIIKFLTNQRIGKIELVTKPWKLPTQTKDSVTKFIFDLEKNNYVKLVGGQEEYKERASVGSLITDFYEMSKSNSNDYSSVIFYRRKSVPGTSTTFANESITRNKMTPSRKKIVENYLKKMIKSEMVKSKRSRKLNEERLPTDPLKSYLVTALWSSEHDDEEEQYSLKGKSVSDFSPKALQLAKSDIRSFLQKAKPYLKGLDLPQVMHDFWLTRNGHGAGFWDGDYDDEVGEQLTKISKSFKEVNCYVGDDGKVHFQ